MRVDRITSVEVLDKKTGQRSHTRVYKNGVYMASIVDAGLADRYVARLEGEAFVRFLGAA